MSEDKPQDPLEEQIAFETLERYSGCKREDFQKSLIITNFPPYVDYFAKSRKAPVMEGTMFKVAHCPKEEISILDFKIGSPAAALVIDTCSFLHFDTAIFLGTCGGLRRRYQVGDYLVPIAAVRAEGTSDYYLPREVPALANFFMQKAITDVLEKEKKEYYIGITYTTNRRFWEFDNDFCTTIKNSRAQGIEMECATLFAASYKRKFPLGALLLISDLPLNRDGILTKNQAQHLFESFTPDHVEKGIQVLKFAREMQKRSMKNSAKEK